jgi:hypothetical protein
MFSDYSVVGAARDGFAMDDTDNAHDLPFISRGIVDVNNIAEISVVTMLNRLARLKGDISQSARKSSINML